MGGWTVRTSDAVAIISPEGDFANFEQVKQLWGILESQMSGGQKRFILDLSATRYLNSTSLGGLVSAYTKVRSGGGRIVIAGMGKKVFETLQTTKLYTVFDVFNSQSEAIAALKSNAV